MISPWCALEVVLCSARMSGSPSGARDFFDSESTALMLIAFIAESRAQIFGAWGETTLLSVLHSQRVLTV